MIVGCQGGGTLNVRNAAAPDGSPVAVYLQAPLEPEFTPLLQAIPDDASVLDLGCGVGRLSNHLASRGHKVVGVDESPEMLQHLNDSVVGVCSAIEELSLSTGFDAVVLASHFINIADLRQRHTLLERATSHLHPDGALFIERYDPAWAVAISSQEGQLGSVTVKFEVLDHEGREFSGRVTYTLEEQQWIQEFRARVVDDAELNAALGAFGLSIRRNLDTRGCWVEAGYARI